MQPLSNAFSPTLKISELALVHLALRELVQAQLLELEYQRASADAMKQAIRRILHDGGEQITIQF